MELETKSLSLTLTPPTGSFQIQSKTDENVTCTARMAVSVARESQVINLLPAAWDVIEQSSPETFELDFGTVNQIQLRLSTSLPEVTVNVRFGLVREQPLALVQMEVINAGDETVTLNRITLLDSQSGDLHLGKSAQPDLTFYSHGWQSWSSTGAYRQGDRQHTSILGRFQNPMVVNSGTPQPKEKDHFSGDMFGVLGDLANGSGLLAGFLSQKAQFGSLEAWLGPQPALSVWANGDHVQVAPGTQVTTDWLALSFVDLNSPEPLAGYLNAVSAVHTIQSTEPVPVGWCSWYHFYQDIDQDVINANLESVTALKPDLPLPLFQIDDGFETTPGDWVDFTSGFPQGLRPIVDKAKAEGLTPGLWLAPFIVHPKAKLVQEHPDWLLRDRRGKPVTAGFVWNSFTYALDLTHPEALAYTCEVIRRAVQEWGFEYLKLDFLYAAALDGVYQNPALSRAQVLRMGLAALREAAGSDVTMLACGCPFGSALGLFEAMRVSADVSGYWKPHFPPVSPILQNEPHMPSAHNAIHNILTRASLHRRWWVNDPDCLLVRPDTHLTLPEVQSLASAIGLTGGSLLVSDDLPQLPEDRLRLVQILLPVIDRRAQVSDLFETNFPARLRLDLEGPTGAWHLLARFNWDAQPAPLSFYPDDFELPKGTHWWLHEFWTGDTGQMSAAASSPFRAVPAHGVRVVAARPFDSSQPTYLGSNLHFSQGLEVSRWQVGQDGLQIQFALGHQVSGRVFLYLPWQPASASFREQSIPLESLGMGLYALNLEAVDGETVIVHPA